MALNRVKSILIVLFVLGVQLTFAQKTEIQNAYNSLGRGELEDALKSINNAANDESTKTMAKTWVYKGEIMYEIYKSPKDKSLVVDPLGEAFISFKKARELDEKKNFKADIEAGFLSIYTVNYNLGVEAFNKLEYGSAYKRFSRVAEVVPLLNQDDPKLKINKDTAEYFRGYSAFKVEKYPAAKNIFGYLIDSSKYRTPGLFINQTNTLLALNDTTGALAVLQKGKSYFPDNNELMISELNIFLFTNRYSEAIGKLNEAIAKNPKSPDLYNALGNAYDRVKDSLSMVKASEAYQKAIDLKPDYYQAYYSLGAEYYNEAVKYTKAMNKLGTSDKEQNIYNELKKLEMEILGYAIKNFEAAYAINNKDMETLTALKACYVLTSQTDKANKIKKEIEDLDGK